MATKQFKIPGDDRSYLKYKPDDDYRYHIRCLASEDREDGTVWPCTFTQREDKFRTKSSKDNYHKCNFKNPAAHRTSGQRTLDRLHAGSSPPDPCEISPIAEEIAKFVGRANVSINAVCEGDLRSLLVRVFKEGWEASLHFGGSVDAAAMKYIPRCTRTQMARAMDRVAEQSRKELLGTFSEYKYISPSIDGVAISTRKFFNVDVVNPVSSTCPFTYDFLTTSDMDTPTFVTLVRPMLGEMRDDGLCVGGVTSDGCAFQKKGFEL
jgi:hypothetical protein